MELSLLVSRGRNPSCVCEPYTALQHRYHVTKNNLFGKKTVVKEPKKNAFQLMHGKIELKKYPRGITHGHHASRVGGFRPPCFLRALED